MVKAGIEAQGVILRNGEDLVSITQAAAFDLWLPAPAMASPRVMGRLTGLRLSGNVFVWWIQQRPALLCEVIRVRQITNPSLKDARLRIAVQIQYWERAVLNLSVSCTHISYKRYWKEGEEWVVISFVALAYIKWFFSKVTVDLKGNIILKEKMCCA